MHGDAAVAPMEFRQEFRDGVVKREGLSAVKDTGDQRGGCQLCDTGNIEDGLCGGCSKGLGVHEGRLVVDGSLNGIHSTEMSLIAGGPQPLRHSAAPWELDELEVDRAEVAIDLSKVGLLALL